MGREIERKFLVRSDDWRDDTPGARIRQGYLAVTERISVRVRKENGHSTLNIKGVEGDLVTRDEFEYDIDPLEADHMLEHLCHAGKIEKTRYKLPYGGFIWEVDEFEGDNAGLVMAEIELTDAAQEFPLPPWLGEEVSNDPHYLNSYLSARPYSTW